MVDEQTETNKMEINEIFQDDLFREILKENFQDKSFRFPIQKAMVAREYQRTAFRQR